MAARSEAEGPFGAAHTLAVGRLARKVALRLGLRGRELGHVELGALVHDIGKVRIPRSLLLKPSPLTSSEWAVLRGHPETGERLLAEVATPLEVLAIVRSHHERRDGMGYPDGLAGDEIPLGARIVSVCDAYRAMRERRPYRTSLTVSAARKELEANADTQFDRTCVDALLAVVVDEPERLAPSGDSESSSASAPSTFASAPEFSLTRPSSIPS